MRDHVRHIRVERTQPSSEEGPERELAADAPLFEAEDSVGATDAEDTFEEEFADVVRLSCPDCRQPIAVLVGGLNLPEHALCPTPWNPFGLTVCAGSGRAVAEAAPLDGPGQEQEPAVMAAVLALPAGLDWRTQPFSHVGGPGSRPIRPTPRPLAA